MKNLFLLLGVIFYISSNAQQIKLIEWLAPKPTCKNVAFAYTNNIYGTQFIASTFVGDYNIDTAHYFFNSYSQNIIFLKKINNKIIKNNLVKIAK